MAVRWYVVKCWDGEKYIKTRSRSKDPRAAASRAGKSVYGERPHLDPAWYDFEFNGGCREIFHTPNDHPTEGVWFIVWPEKGGHPTNYYKFRNPKARQRILKKLAGADRY